MLSHEGLESNDVKELVARRAVAQMERADLEDKHLNLMEENLVRNYLTVSLNSSHYSNSSQLLKKHIKSQEDKMKRYAFY